jgi:multicomponent Na+:H+ antiporter subunit B
MNTIILRTSMPYLMALLLVSSVVLFVRGHHELGGGFSSGLLAASALSLYAIVHGVERARRLLRIDPKTLTAVGLLMTAISGAAGFLENRPFLTATWNGAVGTPLLFDAGVYAVVAGMALTIVFSLKED